MVRIHVSIWSLLSKTSDMVVTVRLRSDRLMPILVKKDIDCEWSAVSAAFGDWSICSTKGFSDVEPAEMAVEFFSNLRDFSGSLSRLPVFEYCSIWPSTTSTNIFLFFNACCASCEGEG